MDIPYGVVESGTTADRLMLWGPDFPIIEINAEDRSTLPKVTLVGNTGMGRVVEATFEDAPRLPFEVREEHRHAMMSQLHGWMMTVTDDFRSLILLDPHHRYQFQFVMEHEDLSIYLDDLHSDEGPWCITFSRESLLSVDAWPALHIDTRVPACHP